MKQAPEKSLYLRTELGGHPLTEQCILILPEPRLFLDRNLFYYLLKPPCSLRAFDQGRRFALPIEHRRKQEKQTMLLPLKELCVFATRQGR